MYSLLPLLVLFMSSSMLCNSSVVSIGLHVAPTNGSESTDITSITLYWHNAKIICQIIPFSYDKWYHCNTSTFISYQTNCQSSQQTLVISIPINDGLWIDEIEILDNDNIRYHYSTFCSSLIFPLWQSTNATCSNYQSTAWTVFCIGNTCNNITSLNIDLSYNAEAAISQSVTSENFCTNINPTISPTNTVTLPKLGVTLPLPMSSPTQNINHGIVFETTIISTSVSQVVSTIHVNKHSFNFMKVLLPTLLITICVCFLSVVCFLICKKSKRQKKKRRKKSKHHKHVEMQMQSTHAKTQQILIRNHLNGNEINNTDKITLAENSSSDCEEFVGSKTNSRMEGRGNFLQNNGKKIHKATFDSVAVAQYSLPVTPMQSPQRRPVAKDKMPVIIASDEDSDFSDSLYLEENKNEHNGLTIELCLKDLGNTKSGATPGGKTPDTPGNN